ncbi:MAG: hypothetical protein QXG00_01420 [Candidatus Woesearchaeota archaeon]
MKKKRNQAWVITADMGYGHQRAANPLQDIAYERIITANSDKLISEKDQRIWRKAQAFYNWISRFTEFPIIGRRIFNMYDRIQSIVPYYPFRDLSRPTIAVNYVYVKIKKGLCSGLISYLKSKDLPIITTFFIPALAADFYGLKNIYCVVTDTDINRVWVARDPKKSNIKYFAPCEKAARRLKEYGVKQENIYLTGFPLPKENLGGPSLKNLKHDLAKRIINLDPKKIFISKYEDSIKKHLGIKKMSFKKDHKLTITFMIGGAGVQAKIGLEVLKSLRKKIFDKEIILNLATGTHMEIYELFMKEIKHLGLDNLRGEGVRLLRALDKRTYFSIVNKALRTTDILWTKPSEMVFFTALGLPLIMTEPIGYHEYMNKNWVEHIGSGYFQYDPKFVNEWLDDWLNDGRLADAAWQGFLDAPKLGTYEIERIVFNHKKIN